MLVDADVEPAFGDDLVVALHVAVVLPRVLTMLLSVVLDEHAVSGVGHVAVRDEAAVRVGDRMLQLRLGETRLHERQPQVGLSPGFRAVPDQSERRIRRTTAATSKPDDTRRQICDGGEGPIQFGVLVARSENEMVSGGDEIVERHEWGQLQPGGGGIRHRKAVADAPANSPVGEFMPHNPSNARSCLRDDSPGSRVGGDMDESGLL